MRENAIICISREFGSGGRDLGDHFGEMLGIPVYGKEWIAKVAQKSDMSEEYVRNHEENPAYSHIFGVPLGHPAPGVSYDEIMTPEKLFYIQSEIIQQIAKEEKSCVFVGRCADIILQSYENCYAFFIHAPMDYRIERIMRSENVTKKQAKKMVKQTDWERSAYHDYYTGIKWGHPSNYNLVINTAKTGIERAARVIAEYIK